MSEDSIADDTSTSDAIHKDGTVYVAEKKRTNLFMAILLIVAGMFLVIGISSLATIMALIQSTLMTFLSTLTGWNPILANIFIGIICLFIATLIYVVVRRGSEIAQKIESIMKMNITNEPTEYYALDMIPHEELMHEFKKRGCIVQEEYGGGVNISCPDIPLSRRVSAVIHPDKFTLSTMQKFAVIAVVLVIWSVYIGTILYSIVSGDMIWMVGVTLTVLSALLLLGSRVIRLWHTIILLTAVNITLSMFFLTDAVVIWTLWGVEAVYIILIAISYLLYRGQCELGNKWYCDVM